MPKPLRLSLVQDHIINLNPVGLTYYIKAMYIFVYGTRLARAADSRRAALVVRRHVVVLVDPKVGGVLDAFLDGDRLVVGVLLRLPRVVRVHRRLSVMRAIPEMWQRQRSARQSGRDHTAEADSGTRFPSGCRDLNRQTLPALSLPEQGLDGEVASRP